MNYIVTVSRAVNETTHATTHSWDKPAGTEALSVESWSQGLMLGALMIMIGITMSNIRSGVLLHKLILAELIIAIPDCFFIFYNPPIFGWYLSTTSTLIICSWSLHNVVGWIKNKPFLQPAHSWIYIGTVALAQAYWGLEIYANFAYFNGFNENLFPRTRPFEALFRDPWWIFTVINVFWNIKHRYNFSLVKLLQLSPRFVIMLVSMCLSIVFIIVDILSVTTVINMGGLNPFWKIAFIFKCFTDTIILDDFKTALDKLTKYKMQNIRMESVSNDTATRRKSSFRPALGSTVIGGAAGNVDPGNPNVIHVERCVDITTIEEPRDLESGHSSQEYLKTANKHESWLEDGE